VPPQRVDVLAPGVRELAPGREQLERRRVHRVVLAQRLVDDLLAQRQHDVAQVARLGVGPEHLLPHRPRGRAQVDRVRGQLVARAPRAGPRYRASALTLVEPRHAEP
jgi:hypothetical protein